MTGAVVVTTAQDGLKTGRAVERECGRVVPPDLEQHPVGAGGLGPFLADADQPAGHAVAAVGRSDDDPQQLGGVVEHTEAGDGFDAGRIPADQHQSAGGVQFTDPRRSAPALRTIESGLFKAQQCIQIVAICGRDDHRPSCR
ncbi:hypothetical protein SDC9_176443 [bioreactor metagenome]|uniref:Uncharacterized protein n=1 Tax=bioreactor metagenome TaxID=1076179 RepID=A0A645GS02_9ZZZZ